MSSGREHKDLKGNSTNQSYELFYLTKKFTFTAPQPKMLERIRLKHLSSDSGQKVTKVTKRKGKTILRKIEKSQHF